MTEVWNVIFSAVTITAFVSMMMLAIEYLNVSTEGLLIKTLAGNKIKGYFLGAMLGASPGCLGAFAMVSLYSHKRVTMGAIVTTMIATSGDEAFVMIGLFPQTAVLLFTALAVIGIGAGWLTDSVILKNSNDSSIDCCNFQHHPHHEKTAFRISDIKKQWRHPSAVRGILSVTLSLFLLLMFAFKFGIISSPGQGQHSNHNHQVTSAEQHSGETNINRTNVQHADSQESEHSHGTGGWTWYTLVGLLIFGLFIVSTVSEHFLEEHLWEHVFKSHIPRIFFWTLGAMAVMATMDHFINLSQIISDNLWIVLLIAVAIGFIPESGPHLIFVTLFAQGLLPISILAASSIVQDGHGMVPLLAHSRKDFITVKMLNAAVGLIIGVAMLALGF